MIPPAQAARSARPAAATSTSASLRGGCSSSPAASAGSCAMVPATGRSRSPERVDIPPRCAVCRAAMVERVPGRNAFEEFPDHALVRPGWGPLRLRLRQRPYRRARARDQHLGDQTLEGSFALAEQARRGALPRPPPARRHRAGQPFAGTSKLGRNASVSLDAPGAHQPYGAVVSAVVRTIGCVSAATPGALPDTSSTSSAKDVGSPQDRGRLGVRGCSAVPGRWATRRAPPATVL